MKIKRLPLVLMKKDYELIIIAIIMVEPIQIDIIMAESIQIDIIIMVEISYFMAILNYPFL